MMKKHFQFGMLVILACAGFLPSSAENQKEQGSEVHQLFLADQGDRERFKGVIGSPTEMQKISNETSSGRRVFGNC
jgi:hypothetical protein